MSLLIFRLKLCLSQHHSLTHTHGVAISYSNSDKLSPKWELHFTVHVPATSRLHPILDSLICSVFTFSFSFSGQRFAWFFACMQMKLKVFRCVECWARKQGKKTYRRAITLAFLSAYPNLKIWRSRVARGGVCTQNMFGKHMNECMRSRGSASA